MVGAVVAATGATEGLEGVDAVSGRLGRPWKTLGDVTAAEAVEVLVVEDAGTDEAGVATGALTGVWVEVWLFDVAEGPADTALPAVDGAGEMGAESVAFVDVREVGMAEGVQEVG